MCGRYVITSAPEAIRALFGYVEQPNFPARYNVAPTQPIPIVRMEAGTRHFALVRWGLIPPWVKDPRAFALLINARGESVREKPAFRNAMRRRRCLIPADGFYEWRAGAGGKQPYYIHASDGRPLAFAGLWETWIGPNGEEVETAAIVTTTANATLSVLHDRMPVVLAPDQHDLWLDAHDGTEDAAARLIVPAPDDLLVFHPVTRAVNRTANDSAALVAALTQDQMRQEAEAETSARRAPRKAAMKETVAKKPARPSPKDDGQTSLF